MSVLIFDIEEIYQQQTSVMMLLCLNQFVIMFEDIDLSAEDKCQGQIWKVPILS